MNSITISNLTKKYGEITALGGISFDVLPGEMFAVLGPDGAGKTTLFRILTTLIEPDSGNAVIFGYDSVRNSPDIRKITGYMPQKFSLYPDLTVAENIRFYSDLFSVPKAERIKKTEILLGFSKLKKFTGFKAGNLSGGMKQKLALSCALIHTPRLLVLDEPTGGVDPVSRQEFWTILAALKKEGVTIIYSTPYMDEASRADRIVLMHKGVILASGTQKEIIENFNGFIYSVKGENLQALARVFKPVFGIQNVQILGDHLRVCLDDRNQIIKLNEVADSNSLNISDVRIVPAGIEDAFIGMLKND